MKEEVKGGRLCLSICVCVCVFVCVQKAKVKKENLRDGEEKRGRKRLSQLDDGRRGIRGEKA